jgi:DNA-binding winged helix-turn-helix (wHTH) protein/predicted negative regulator of RcsB-dependent stress response
MIYNFSLFSLNTDAKELTANGKPIPLTKQGYELLLLFVQNTERVFSKNEIIDEVWKGRYVTENTIDQSISKLRKVLNSVAKDTYIKTGYGKGFKFEPTVKALDAQLPDKRKAHKSYKLTIAFAALVLLMLVLLLTNREDSLEARNPETLLLIVSDANASSEDVWLNQGSVTFIDQLFGFANAAKLKEFKNKPEYQNREQYIEHQWKISPDLKVVTTNVSQKDKLYTVTLSMVDKLRQKSSQSFSNQNLGLALSSASRWLAQQVNQSASFSKIQSLIPQDSYIVELYMRGLSSYGKGEFDKAEHLFLLCIEEKSDFHLARLQLALVKRAQGKMDKALALLDTLRHIEAYPQIEIEVQTIRGDIYDTQGKYEQAKDLYLSVLKKYKDNPLPQLNEIRYNLSYTYAILTEYEKALTELNKLESTVVESENAELLANVLQKKASILQKIGQTEQAKLTAEKALSLFSKIEDLLGEAKVYVTLARVASHRANYKEAIKNLEQALLINKSLDYKLGVGATLNELIYLLMVQGDFDKAWKSNSEMQKIAIDIDYNAMLQISKQYAIDISRVQKKWKTAEIYLQEHLQLAKASNNKRALLKNKLLALDLYIDEEKIEQILPLIKEVQDYIDESKEARLQPRINKKLAEYYFLIGEDAHALVLLSSTKELALKTQDGEITNEINELLAKHYIGVGQADKALTLLEESYDEQRLAYPYLLLKAKANQLKGKQLKALDLANECKNLSNEWWSAEDDRFLRELESKIN